MKRSAFTETVFRTLGNRTVLHILFWACLFIASVMKEVGSLLPAGTFFRVHKSYTVNFRHVSKIERDQVKVGPKLIPIGESFREDFLKKIGTRS